MVQHAVADDDVKAVLQARAEQIHLGKCGPLQAVLRLEPLRQLQGVETHVHTEHATVCNGQEVGQLSGAAADLYHTSVVGICSFSSRANNPLRAFSRRPGGYPVVVVRERGLLVKLLDDFRHVLALHQPLGGYEEARDAIDHRIANPSDGVKGLGGVITSGSPVIGSAQGYPGRV